ncbi:MULTISPECIES: hypothetical protein [Priestia]|uniref:Uncharacterized protein n=2 Tax=Priestia TaxID=2800373 RepID=A0AAX6BN79_PRIMG|nr:MULTISPECIES: hypothetical protein [Priestia]MBK0294100.1 hypothetical protein [Bacillus sp. S34]MCL9635970.1 hypothetical protein [Bacillus zanthoxyli]UPK51460.1 hypothetical protein MT476_07660 [Bacillus sp. H8-1]AWD63603.1 hypothetical protein C2I28_00445 [Priestia megaterium]KML30747.1 hypothetical protein VL11_06505 [Priestia aryabhattai]
MPKKDFKDVDNSGIAERVDYNNYKNKDSNNDPTLNRIVEEDGRALDPRESLENFFTDLEGEEPQEITT